MLHYMFRPAGHHQVLLRLGDCCTSFSLLVAFKILKFYIYLVCHLLRIVYFFCVPCARSATFLCVCRVARDTVKARRDCIKLIKLVQQDATIQHY
jgi:hypothetical protein